jgi:hypothetical protein
MVLYGYILELNTMVTLFTLGKSNILVFGLFPFHLHKQLSKKYKVQFYGDVDDNIRTPIVLTLVMLPLHNYFLDMALGVLEDPSYIINNENYKQKAVLKYKDDNILTANSNAQVVHLTGNSISTLDVKLLETNYDLGDYENFVVGKCLPTPGSYLMIDIDAKKGFSGSMITQNGNVLGMIVCGSALSLGSRRGYVNATKLNRCLAVDMYYMIPTLIKNTDAVHRTINSISDLDNLSKSTKLMNSLKDDLTPEVNNLGLFYSHSSINHTSKVNKVIIHDLQEYIETKTLHPLPFINSDNNCVELETLVNKNDEFVDYFQSNKHDSIISIVGMTYYDKIFNKRVNLSFKDNLDASLLEYVYRGSAQDYIELTVRTEKKNDDDTISVLLDKTFKFNSNLVSDKTRLNSQLPSSYFSSTTVLKNNSFFMYKVLDNRRLVPVSCTWLDADDNAAVGTEVASSAFEEGTAAVSEC